MNASDLSMEFIKPSICQTAVTFKVIHASIHLPQVLNIVLVDFRFQRQLSPRLGLLLQFTEWLKEWPCSRNMVLDNPDDIGLYNNLKLWRLEKYPKWMSDVGLQRFGVSPSLLHSNKYCSSNAAEFQHIWTISFWKYQLCMGAEIPIVNWILQDTLGHMSV